MAVILKIKTTRPSLDSQFFFEVFLDWQNRPWIENVEAAMAMSPGLLRATMEEHISRDEIVARRNELRPGLEFIADDCMDFEPEYHDPLQVNWPSWGADMSPPFNPFSLTHTSVMEFDTEENARNWLVNSFREEDLPNLKSLLQTHNNTIQELLLVDGVEQPIVSRFNA